MFKLLSSLFSKNLPSVPAPADKGNQVLTDAQLLRANFSVTEQDEEALLALSSWVEVRGFHLLHLDLGDDAYRALLAAAEQSEQIMRAAQAAGLKLQRSSDFAADSADSYSGRAGPHWR